MKVLYFCAFIFPVHIYSFITLNSKISILSSELRRVTSRAQCSGWICRSIPAQHSVKRRFYLPPFSRNKILCGGFLSKHLAIRGCAPFNSVESRIGICGPIQIPNSPDDKPFHECIVRCVDGEPHLSISVNIAGLIKTLTRMQDDPVGEAIDRLQAMANEIANKNDRATSYHKKKKPKRKGKGKRRQDDISVEADGNDDVGAKVSFLRMFLSANSHP